MVLLLSSRSFQTHVKAIGIFKVVGALQQRGMLDQVRFKQVSSTQDVVVAQNCFVLTLI